MDGARPRGRARRVTAAARQSATTRALAGGDAGMVPLERVRPGAQRLDRAQDGAVGAEGQELGRPGERVDDLRRERARERRQLVVATAAPREQRRHGEREGQRDRERQRGPGQDEADGDDPDDAGAHGDGHRQQGAQIEVLQGVDVVDGAGQEVAAAPPGEGGRHAGGEAVVEPHPPPGQRAQGGVVAHQPLLVAQRPAEEGQHLDGGQDADDGIEAGPQGRPADHVAGPGQEADGRGRGGEAQQARDGEAAVGGAGFARGRGAGSRPGAGRSRRDHQGARGRRQGDDGVEAGEQHRLVRGHHDGAATEPRLDRRRERGPPWAGRATRSARRAGGSGRGRAGRGPGRPAAARPSSA